MRKDRSKERKMISVPKQAECRLWRTVLGLFLLFSMSSVYADSWQFRGTPNSWGTTPMVASGNNDYVTCQQFSGSNPRFKIDHYGDWSENYPDSDYLIENSGSYQITFNSGSKQVDATAVAKCDDGDDGDNDTSNLVFYFDANDFSSAPTIWAWIPNGSAISELEGYGWNAQQVLTIDADSGYYVWSLPGKYQGEIDSGLQLNFIIDKADEFSRSTTGCYSDNRWFDNLVDCLEQPFSPYIGPYLTLIQPTTTGAYNTATVLNPASNMVINYELAGSHSNFTAQAYFRKAGDTEWQVQAEDNVADLAPGWGKVHHITLSNLQADTEYEYKVTSPAGEFSSQYAFITAKNEMDYSRFLVVGDMQDEQGQQRWHDVAQAIVNEHMDDFDFIITVGDMVKDDIPQNGERFYWWKVFFDKGQTLFASKAMLPAMGNHDTPGNSNVSDSEQYWSNAEDTRSFRKYFYLTPDMSYPDYYSFQYGNACFMSVNSEIPVFYGRYPERDHGNNAAAQGNWLQDEVNQAQSCPWSFAYWHVPAINPAGGKDEVKYLRPYVNYFNQKLDWAITGHVHEYQRLKPVTATSHSLDFKAEYGRDANKGVGYMIAAPAGQWPRNNSSSDMHILAYYPHNSNGVAYEIGFSIINISGNHFDLKTYGMGSVGTQEQPSGYRSGNDRSKQLIDAVSYSKQGLTADAGDDITVMIGSTVQFDASGSTSANGSIVSYQWSNGLTGISPTKLYADAGTYPVTLTVTDDKGETATDTITITVTDDTNYKQDFSSVDFRGTANGWSKTAMRLVGDYRWQITVTVTDSNPSFKFYADGKWYGDNEPDGETHSNEYANIAITQGPGTYQITLTDNIRRYQVNKL
ncbi:PKD domain-containing protein [Corallincola holothuriorum]|uniref:PKD domain-containing protein n=2 Tax=Corallincola holothuriorum TaxID=2282215 RepID=A0A368N671_9GAMM|nr:PKD domain-containing protein [Corallincola holothuriorum]